MMLIYLVCLTALANGFAIQNEYTESQIARISGGDELPVDVVPYQVSIQQDGNHICGGVIVKDDIVLTAAQCTDGKNAEMLSVKGGLEYLPDEGYIYAVENIIQHENFSLETLDYDISILKLKNKIQFNSYIQPVVMIDNGYYIPPGMVCVVSGWGAKEEGGNNTDFLQYAITDVIDHASCQKSYKDYLDVTDNMLCTEMQGINTCEGDIGGPLTTSDFLIGLISWSKGCGAEDLPSVYTSIPAVRKWIDENILDPNNE